MHKDAGIFYVLSLVQLQRYIRCMDHEIYAWLNSGQDYHTGLLLYDRCRKNTSLGRILRIGGATVKNRLTLSYELGKIARQTVPSGNLPDRTGPTEKQETIKPERPIPSEAITVDTLRSQQKMCYKMLDNLHAVLPYRETQERKEIAFQILDIDGQLNEITERIAHYEAHGVFPPALVNDGPGNVSELGEAGLILRQNNVRTYIARYKRLVAGSKSPKTLSRNRELLEKFQLELDDINKKLGK